MFIAERMAHYTIQGGRGSGVAAKRVGRLFGGLPLESFDVLVAELAIFRKPRGATSGGPKRATNDEERQEEETGNGEQNGGECHEFRG